MPNAECRISAGRFLERAQSNGSDGNVHLQAQNHSPGRYRKNLKGYRSITPHSRSPLARRMRVVNSQVQKWWLSSSHGISKRCKKHMPYLVTPLTFPVHIEKKNQAPMPKPTLPPSRPSRPRSLIRRPSIKPRSPRFCKPTTELRAPFQTS